MKKESYYKIVITALSIALAIVIFQNQIMISKLNKNNIQLSDEQIINNLKQFPEIKPYENYQRNITLLTENDLKELKQRQPAIYSNIQSGTYRVIFTSNENGLLVLYDANQNKILKMFEIRNMVL